VGSAADELCLSGAVLDERGHADLLVLRREQCRELLPLDRQSGVEVDLQPEIDRLLGRANRIRRAVRELRRPRESGVVDLLGRDDLVDKPDPQGLLGVRSGGAAAECPRHRG
jgi:hypothetical protein